MKIGSQQSTGKMMADIPAIGTFPEVKLAEVPKDSLLLTQKGAVPAASSTDRASRPSRSSQMPRQAGGVQ